jgi:hypothetical protein
MNANPKTEHLTKFVKGQISNPNGRPKKTLSMLNDQLKAEGYEVVTKAVLMELYGLFMGIDEEKVKEIAKDKEQPLVARLVIKDITGENGAKAIQDMRNYSFGQATQQIEQKINHEVVTLFEIPKNGRDQGS